jgi:hypothetical protein
LQVGSLDTKKAAEPEPKPEPKKEVKKEAAKPAAESGAVVPMPAEDVEPLDPFGDLIPFADPTWYQGVRYLSFCTTLSQNSSVGIMWYFGPPVRANRWTWKSN